MSAVPPRAARRAQTRQESRRHARDIQRQRELRARYIQWAIWAGIAVLVLAGIGAWVIYQQKAQPGKVMPIQGQEHIDKGAPHVAYNSTPPTSGPHWSIGGTDSADMTGGGGQAPVDWGIYDAQIADEAQVHNLEHGGIMIQYNCHDCPELVASLKDFYSRYASSHRLPFFPNSTKIVVAPYYTMPDRIALTAWGHIDMFGDYNEDRVVRFVEAYRDKGPEPVP